MGCSKQACNYKWKEKTDQMKNNDPLIFQSTVNKNLVQLKAQKKQANYNMKMILNQSTVNKNPAQL